MIWCANLKYMPAISCNDIWINPNKPSQFSWIWMLKKLLCWHHLIISYLRERSLHAWLFQHLKHHEWLEIGLTAGLWYWHKQKGLAVVQLHCGFVRLWAQTDCPARFSLQWQVGDRHRWVQRWILFGRRDFKNKLRYSKLDQLICQSHRKPKT